MGMCLSSRVKAESPSHTGIDQPSVCFSFEQDNYVCYPQKLVFSSLSSIYLVKLFFLGYLFSLDAYSRRIVSKLFFELV